MFDSNLTLYLRRRAARRTATRATYGIRACALMQTPARPTAPLKGPLNPSGRTRTALLSRTVRLIAGSLQWGSTALMSARGHTCSTPARPSRPICSYQDNEMPQSLCQCVRHRYRMFQLLNKEFAFDVDVSQLECGLNGALYFVRNELFGSKGEYS